MWSRSYEPELIPSVAPPFGVFPSHPAVPGSPSPSVFPRSSMSPPGLPLSLLFGAPFPQIPARPLPVSNSSALQVTSANLRGVSRARVRCTNKSLPTCPCPILPWAFRTSVHRCPGTVRSHPKIGPKPGRTLLRNQPESLIRSHVLQTPLQSPQPELCHLSKSLASGLRFPVNSPHSEDWFLLTRLRRSALTHPLNPPPCEKSSGKPLYRPEQKS